MNKKLLLLSAILVAAFANNIKAFKKATQPSSAVAPASSATQSVVQKPAVKTQVNPVAPQKPIHSQSFDANLITQEVMQEEIKILKSNLIDMLLQHPILGTNKELATQTIQALRAALSGIENDQRVQALPTKAQFTAQLQNAPKRQLTRDEEIFLLSAASHKKSENVYPMYLQMRPDVISNASFADLIKHTATSHPITAQEEAALLKAAASWPKTALEFGVAYDQYLKAHHISSSTDLFFKVSKIMYENK